MKVRVRARVSRQGEGGGEHGGESGEGEGGGGGAAADLLLPAAGHLELRELLERESRELVGTQRLGLLGEGEEAIGLRDAEGRLVAQQPRE